MNRRKPVFAVRTLIVTAAVAATAIGCTWNLFTDHSVRFNAFRTGSDFYRLPPLPIMYDGKTGKEISVQTQTDTVDPYEYEYPDTESKQSPGDKTWQEIQDAIQHSTLTNLPTLLEKFLDETKTAMLSAEPDHARRNAAYDMLDALTALKQRSKVASVTAYLDARSALWVDTASGTSRTVDLEAEVIEQAAADRNLQDNVEYLRAALLVHREQTTEALQAFEEHLKKYPHSEKNDASMYMVAKLTMQSSYSFTHAGCGVQGKSANGDDIPSDAIEPKEKCQDENWSSALDAFQKLMQKYPRGRYREDARGWIAYLYRRGGERAKALAEYYRMLGHPTDRNVRLEGKKSLQIIGHEYDDATLDEVEKLIADDLDASMAYAYHRIYNQAVDLTAAEIEPWCCTGEDEWQQRQDEEERVDTAHESGKHELERVVRFATSMMKRYPNARVSAGFVVRVSEASLESGNYADARRLATKALAMGAERDDRAEALWIKGSAEHQQKNFANARSSFERLMKEFPDNRLTEGAHRLLAMAGEDQGDLESALVHYIALNYRYDAAYFVDVLMPTDRLAKFVASRPTHPQHDWLLYALGVRYMRERRWHEARETLRQVRTERGKFEIPNLWDDDREPTRDKEPEWGEDSLWMIKTGWVIQDLKTIDVLEHMEQVVQNSPDDESRAEAIYQLASYQFEADDLLFYNPAAWRGMRVDLLVNLEYGDHVRAPNETQTIFEHAQSHDTYARAIPIYLEIANRYPNTRAAKDALYSAAVAHERLSNSNNYWRAIYAEGLFAGPRKLVYADVKSAYPRYQLPQGTDGWKPSTRTVNGGPGWAAPPKPLPRETREHRVKRWWGEFKGELSTIWTKFSTNVETKVEGGVSWYGSMIEAAIYGIISGVGLWALILVGLGLHLRKSGSNPLVLPPEPKNADSRVDQFIE